LKKDTLISVVIPAYNAAQYLEQCIQNVLLQSYKNLEIIVVDDGSKDNTREIAQQYPVKLIQQENQGSAAARNAGIQAATGEYIHFMDADDLINLNFYERMLDAILSVDADMACCGFIHERLPAFNSVIIEQFVFINTEDKMTFTNVGHQGAAWKYLFKISFLRSKKLLFDLNLRVAQDKAFSLQAVFYANKIISVPNAVYIYKVRNNSAMTASTTKQKKNRKKSIKEANEFCKKFANEHHLKTISSPRFQLIQYKLFGLPIIKKRIYNTGKVNWYLFGIFILQKK
jgi:glycosyltransferase involved in cell wall biosynthesis